MSIRSHFDLEKTELDAVLVSETFARSPNLAKMLRYIGHKYFEGQEELLKEYNIGVEALGRAQDFDPKQNSIVRVEAHHLREKLKRYYETEGADRPVVITLQIGHYIPQFIRRNEANGSALGCTTSEVISAAPVSQGSVAAPPDPTPQLVANRVDSEPAATLEVAGNVPSLPSQRPGLKLPIGFALLLLLAGLGIWAFMRSKPDAAGVILSQTMKNSPTAAADEGQSVRIIAGYSKKDYVDRLGRKWGPDRYYAGGEALVEPQITVARATDSTLFATARQGTFSYDVPLKQGIYELRLYFVETDYGPATLRGGGETSRLFHLDINGKRIQTDFDVLSDAGGTDIGDERVYKDISPAPDGYLHLNFIKAIDYPIVNAIEIVPGLPGKLQPIRIVAQEHSYTDEAGRLWSPDCYFYGGRMITLARSVEGTPDPGLYSGERYGHFDYAIPVAEGRYAMTLHFAETYFGPSNPGKTGVGSRLFDVYCNGVALLRSFDIFKEAGGENRAVQKTFHGLKPNALGKLMISFVPVKNYASVKAIEVLGESR